MEYEYELTVTAGTTKDSPVTVDCQLSKGIVHQYEIAFLQGCNNLVSVVVVDGGFQCFPINMDGAFKGNADTVAKKTFYPLVNPPYKLTAKAWAPDCSYNHQILLRFDVLPREYFENISDIEAVIKAVTGELQREYVETAGSITERLELVAQQITPQAPADLAETGSQADGPDRKDESILAEIGNLDRVILESQIRQGWSDDRIIAANKANGRLDPGKLSKILAALREKMRGGNG